MWILIIDDHAPTRKLLERNLEAASHGVKLATSCAQASTALAMGMFDVDVPELVARDP